MAIVLIMIMSSLAVLIEQPLNSSLNGVSPARASFHQENTTPPGYNPSIMIPVPASPGSVSGTAGGNYTGTVKVLLTFNLTNQTRLNSFLHNLSDPSSTQYHQYISRSQFRSEYAPSGKTYNTAVSYFQSQYGLRVTTYSDHLSMSVSGGATAVGKALSTSFVSSGAGVFHASSEPRLPSGIAQGVSDVVGLTNAQANIAYNMHRSIVRDGNASGSITQSGFPTPVNQYGTQLIYGSDMQVAYNEQSLLNVTYPTKEVVATILWAGNTTGPGIAGGTTTAPYYPADVYAYFNATLPSYEPIPSVHGVPVNGAPGPGVSATNDASGAVTENTLDLEMAGSTAPGASIYNVYGNTSSFFNIDSAFNFILNPNASFRQLNNVSVISNSWGGMEQNDTAWFTYLQEAQARGISVLASSGDSGNNPNSQKYIGSNVEFPSAMAYDSFGVTAVGGDTVTLAKSLKIQSQVAWYESSSYSGINGPAGSTGGISSVFNEPSWQKNTEANKLINGQGRGVPDVSGLANNTIIYITQGGVKYYGGGNYYPLGGTSVASPLLAGLVAEINAVLAKYNESSLGYLNPMLYKLGNQEFKSFTETGTTGFGATGLYNSTLPMLPFYEVSSGRNHLYSARYGYDLVTGWGSLNAYNFTNYVLNRSFVGKYYALQGVRNDLSMSGLKVTSYYVNGGSISGTNTYYNASIQQNFFIADQLGAPMYWVQNVIYINGSQSSGWAVNYSGWVVFPFYGLYPSQTVYEYNFPAGRIISFPHDFNITSWITNLSDPGKQTLEFQVNSHHVSIPVPGAAYIIGSQYYNYTHNGNMYFGGPYPDNPFPGGLSPQFGLVGGPSLSMGDFVNPTAGLMKQWFEPVGASNYIHGKTQVYGENVDQTGENSTNLAWTQNANQSWNLGLSTGSTEQGIFSYNPPASFVQLFSEYGLPTGTEWYVELGNGQTLSSTHRELNVTLENGTYIATIYASDGYPAAPSVYRFLVNGGSSEYPVTFDSPVQAKLLSASRTYNFLDNSSQPGIYADFASYYEKTFRGSYYNSISYDPASAEMFVTNSAEGLVQAFNITTGKYVGSISFGTGYQPLNSYFDQYTGNLYVSFENKAVIYSVDPSTMTSAPAFAYVGSVVSSGPALTGYNSGKDIVVMAGGHSVETFNASTGTMLNTYSGVSPYFGTPPSGPFNPFYTQGGNVYFPDQVNSSVDSVNLSTGHVSLFHLPAGVEPAFIQPFGLKGNVIVGTVSSGNYVLNLTSDNAKVVTGTEQGIPMSHAYNPFAGVEYIPLVNTSDGVSTIIVVSTSTGNIIGSPTTIGDIGSVAFDMQTQSLLLSQVYFPAVFQYSAQKYYATDFTQSGLPSGNTWYLNVTGNAGSGPQTGQSHTAYLVNGTYTYTVTTTDKQYHAGGGTFTVNGGPVSISVQFSQVNYAIDFQVQNYNLPKGVSWYVNMTGGYNSGAVSGSSHTFRVANGTYDFTVQLSTKDYRISSTSPTGNSGTVTVKGSGQTLSVIFEPVLFHYTVRESGLPSGTQWMIKLPNGTVEKSTSSSITVTTVNGTYGVDVQNTTAYYSNGYSDSVTVSGSNTTLNVQFTHYAYITGKISPGSAAITVNGKSIAVSGGKFNVSVASGSYKVVVSESGYTTFYENFTLNGGQTKTLNETLTAVSAPSPPKNSSPLPGGDLLYIAIGVAVVVVAGGGIGYSFVRKRR